jgi:DNA-binding NtrC family response regulator
MVKQAGGAVDILSSPGEGTTVKLYFPRSAEGEAQPLKEEEAQPTAGHGESILLVEDDETVRDTVIDMLHSIGYHVLNGEDGREPLHAVTEDDNVDLLLTDVVLPGGRTGISVADEVRRRLPDVKVLLMSGYSDIKNPEISSRIGEFPRLAKPFNRDELANTIEKILG